MAIPGVQSVDLRPEIGSATVHYDPHTIDHKALIGDSTRAGYFDHLKAKTPDERLEEGSGKNGRSRGGRAGRAGSFYVWLACRFSRRIRRMSGSVNHSVGNIGLCSNPPPYPFGPTFVNMTKYLPGA